MKIVQTDKDKCDCCGKSLTRDAIAIYFTNEETLWFCNKRCQYNWFAAQRVALDLQEFFKR